uniref:SLC26A/SulP transporter domain-containing protein n=1 Tax=Romanomermis culicivorax TaxID=13658 RepID=A0A915HU65_ROMCU
LAYGELAGIDPVHGLYTSLFPTLFYIWFGSSRHISLEVEKEVKRSSETRILKFMHPLRSVAKRKYKRAFSVI